MDLSTMIHGIVVGWMILMDKTQAYTFQAFLNRRVDLA